MNLKRFVYPDDRSKIIRKWRQSPTDDPALDRSVWEIIDAVRQQGDQAISEFTHRFDQLDLKPSQFRIEPAELKTAWDSLPKELQKSMETAAKRIARFHRRQMPKGFTIKDATGAILEQRFLPLNAVGLYVPGGKAAYPSTVLMCAVPAFVAGVERVVMVTPPHGDMDLANRATWGAAWLAGVREAYRIGGAQAVAALALGTQTIPRVDKVVGPGNKYVATAKKLLYGQIDIDSVAGPSEVMILADTEARPDFLAVDLMAQAEHDEEASAILVLIGEASETHTLAARVEESLDTVLARSPRRAIALKSLKRNGVVIHVTSEDAAVELANLRAPEHLEIMTAWPRAIAERVRNAGAIFLGRWCPEAFGDYIAGPNHTLPTGGTARFFSPLGIQDFIKSSNILEAGPQTMKKLSAQAAALADVEGLAAHAESLRIRLS